MSTMLGRLSAAFADLVARRPRRVLAAALLLTLASLVPASRFRIETRLEALLPEGAPAAEDYRTFLRTFGGFEKVFVLVRAPQGAPADSETLVNAAGELADRMGRSPLVADARAGLTAEDERFFFTYVAPRMPLLAHSPGWRQDLARRLEPQAIHDRVAEMRGALRSPVGAAAAPLFAADPLGLSEGLLGAAAASLPIDPLSGAFVAPDGDATLVILTPASAEVDPAGGRELLAALQRAYGEVRRSTGVPLDFQAVGGPIYAAQDEAIFRADLSRSASGTFVALALVMILGFEGLFLPSAILAAVAAGTVWMIAGAALELGSISVLGVGFTAALLGMGVDYGILGSSRFRDLRLRGEGVAAALTATFRETGPGIATTAVTTAAGLAALSVAHFRLLRELGQVLSLGVLATLAATATVCAALLAGFPRASARFRPLRLWPRCGQPLLAGIAAGAARRWRLALTLVALLTAAAGWGISRLELSTDLRALRPADAPSGEAERLLVQKFSVGLDTFSVVLRGRDLGEALDRAAAARQILEARLGPRAEITSPADLLVEGNRLRQRLAELRGLPLERAADDLRRELAAAGFKPDPFLPALETLRALGQGRAPGAPSLAQWPRWMSELVRVDPKTRSAVVALHVRLPLGTGAKVNARALARDLYRLSPDRRDVALASVVRVGEELRQLALKDLARSSALALVLVGAVVLISFRGRVRDALLSFLPLTLGCLWAFGLWGALGKPLDLLCAFTVPLLLGTGMTLGANAVHWRRLHPAGGFRGAAADLGLPLTLATLTTVIGFGSLGLSRVPGLRHAGILVALGLSACLLATVLALPALEAALERRRPELPPHAPEASWSRRLLGPFYITGVFWFRLHQFGISVLPKPGVAVIVWFFSSFFWVFLQKIRAGVAANLEAVLGPCGWWERQRRIFRTFRIFAWCLSERYERLSTQRAFAIEAEGLETWSELAAGGRAFILVTAHMGNWEVGSMLPAARDRRRIHVVREAEIDPKAQQFVEGLIRKCSGELYTTHFAEDPQLGMDLLDALRRGEVVALQGDRPRAGGKTVEASLFGHPYPLPVGPAALARAAGVPIVPVFVFREGRLRYRCVIRPAIHVAHSTDRGRDVREATARLAAELETAIRREPHQWFCFRRLWPAGE